jgi:APA family basic amino acid/polyamine antiporter
VRAGSNVQSALMVLKIAAIAFLVLCGIFVAGAYGGAARAVPAATSLGTLGAIGAALTPVMFAYGGWQTASFVAAEMRDPRRDLARGLLLGVIGVILLYTAVAFTCVYVLGPNGLAETRTPATAVMRLALGDTGATLIALGIAISALGFLSQGMLTAPRVYFAMAEDRLFFRKVAEVSATTRVPVFAILLQGAVAIAIALSGTYDRILSYVVSVDFIWFALTGAALFVFRKRDADGADGFRAPGHPVTTGLFVVACAAVVIATVASTPGDSAIGFGILLAGVPAFLFWRSRQ